MTDVPRSFSGNLAAADLEIRPRAQQRFHARLIASLIFSPARGDSPPAQPAQRRIAVGDALEQIGGQERPLGADGGEGGSMVGGHRWISSVTTIC